jgi:hypothetical protein
MFSKLPLGLYYELREFLDPVEYYQSLTTTKSLHHVLLESWKIRINGDTLFEENTQALLSRIKNPGLQLMLRVPKDLDIQPFLVVKSHEIAIDSARSLKEIPNWFEQLCQCYHSAILKDNDSILSFQGNLVTSWKLQKLHIENFPNLTDVSDLSQLNSLTLVNCTRVSDVSCLGTIKSSLRLEKCPGIVDVSTLGNIPNLRLDDCPGIRDISHLTENAKLTILSCPGIAASLQKMKNPHHTKVNLDFFHVKIMETSEKLHSFFQSLSSSSSSSLRELVVENYTNDYIDTSYLKNVSVLRLVCYDNYEDSDDYEEDAEEDNEEDNEEEEEEEGEEQEQEGEERDQEGEQEEVNKDSNSKFTSLGIDCSQLTRLFHITLDSIPYPDLDLSPLYFTPVVELFSLPIYSLQGLGGTKVLHLFICDRIEDFSAARNIPNVNISINPNLVNGIGLEDVEDLTIHSCSSFQDTSQLGNLKKLRIAFCNSLEVVEGIENVSTVSLIRCRDLSSLSGLGNNDKITITKEWENLLDDNPRLSSEFYREDFDIKYPDEIVLIKKS